MKGGKISIKILILLSGLFIGSLFGELLGRFIAQSFIKNLLLESVPIGLKSPLTLDLYFFTLTFGFLLRINFFSLLGLLISSIFAYRLR